MCSLHANYLLLKLTTKDKIHVTSMEKSTVCTTPKTTEEQNKQAGAG